MKIFPLLALALLCALPSSVAAFEISADFVEYMKAVTNPHQFGLRDGRYFPYSTRYGRRVGYGRVVADKSVYSRGETPAEAEQHLRDALAATAVELRTWLATTHPDFPFDSLDRKAQEILLDHAFTEGVARLRPDFCATVLRADWDTLLDQHLYVRGLGNWPDTIINRAFGDRWIYSDAANALRPLKNTVR